VVKNGRYRVFYSDHYTLPLPEGHRFPMSKYRLLRDYLLEHEIIVPEQLQASPIADEELLSLAHDPGYVRAVRDGTLDLQILKRIGFPGSKALFTRSAATVGGAVAAARAALSDGVSGALAGGTHHAHYDRGEGYCVFNDIAVAARSLMKQNLAERIAIIDLDVHQGNGNSSILSSDARVFIASVHGEKNYPFRKIPSTLDVALPDGADDLAFLSAVDQVLSAVSDFAPDFIFYQMGVDALKEDSLGKLDVTHQGLMERDRRVLGFALSKRIPISLALGGGYAKPIEASVVAYANTYRILNQLLHESLAIDEPMN